MVLSTSRYISSIVRHGRSLAEIAPANLDAPIAHCPGWNVADVLEHLVRVHWFWTTIVAERLAAPPDENHRPPVPTRDDLLGAFVAGCAHLVHELERADQGAAVWTWAPEHQTVGFVTRHQVQEIAVHHWDVAHAIGRPIEIEPEIAGDAVDEFLTVSISSAADPADPPRPALAGSVALVASDLDRAWTVSDDSVPGTVLVRDGVVGDASTLRATSQELLLWLYGRCELTDPTTSPELTERLRALSFTN